MKAFVMKRIGQVGVMEKPVPEPGPNDAVVRTTAALVCTSDTHTVAGAIGDRRDLTLGHEAVGTVYKLGSEVFESFCIVTESVRRGIDVAVSVEPATAGG